jgi:hypothetical protein
MPEHEAMTLNFKPFQQPTTDADFTYKITPNTISITDTKRARRSVTEEIEAVLRKNRVLASGINCGVPDHVPGRERDLGRHQVGRSTSVVLRDRGGG